MTELQELLNIIQFDGEITQKDIALKLDLSRKTVNQAIGSGDHEKILEQLRQHYRVKISQFVRRFHGRLNPVGVLMPGDAPLKLSDGPLGLIEKSQIIARDATDRIEGLNATVEEIRGLLTELRGSMGKLSNTVAPESTGNSVVETAMKEKKKGTQ